MVDVIIKSWKDRQSQLPQTFSYELSMIGASVDPKTGDRAPRIKRYYKCRGLGENYTSIIATTETPPKQALTECYLFNIDYSGKLAKHSASDKWMLTSMEANKFEWSDKQTMESVLLDKVYFGNVITGLRQPITDLLSSLRSRITVVSKEHDLIKVEFAYDTPSASLQGLSSGSFVFDPSKDYFLMAGKMKYTRSGEVTIHEFANQTVPHRGIHILSHSEMKNYRNKTLLSIINWTCSASDEEILPKDFYFTAFDIPEPVGTTRRAAISGLTYWLLGGAGLLGGLAVACWYAAKRKARNS